MFIKNIFIKQAAYFIAAFFFLQTDLFAKPIVETFDSIKQKTTKLLIQKQKKEAIQQLSEYLKLEKNKNTILEATEFLDTVAKMFVSKEAQDFYEASLNQTIENKKESKKNNDQCLQIEPQNLDCLIQRIRLFSREKNQKEIEKIFESLKEQKIETKTTIWAHASSHKAEPAFKNAMYFRKTFTENATEDDFVFATLELERAFFVKNYSKAKEVLTFLEKKFSDWPDLVFFKQKISLDSAEDKQNVSAEPNSFYITKCKSLSKSVARKYRYDFDLCNRGVL